MSLMGGNYAPFREPAEGVPFLCAEYSHATGDVLKVSYVNTTKVANFNAAVGGTIEPYERFYDTHSSLACDQNDNCPATPTTAPCESWIGDILMDATVTSPQYTMVGSPGPLPAAPQAFTAQAGSPVNFAVCHQRGFKNVAARRLWHGIAGWLTPDQTATDCVDAVGGGCTPDNAGAYVPDQLRSYIPFAARPDTTKYLTLEVDITYQATDTGQLESTVVNGRGTNSVSVNAQSGEVTASLLTTEDSTLTDAGGTAAVQYSIANGKKTDNTTTPPTITYGNETVVDAYIRDVHGGSNPGPGGTLEGQINGSSADEGGFNATICEALATAANNPDYKVASYRFLNPVTDLNQYPKNTGTLVVPSGYSAGNVTTSVTIGWSRTDKVYSFYYEKTVTYDTLPFDQDNTSAKIWGTLTLSIPNTAADVYKDIVALLATWPLNDDALYPWRTDGTTVMAPKVSRLEWSVEMSPLTYTIGPNSHFGQTVDDLTSPIADGDGNTAFSTNWHPTYTQRAWFDPNIYAWGFAAGKSSSTAPATGLVKLFDGSIQGAPNPAGYQGYFRFDAENWQACCETSSDGSSATIWYPYGHGVGNPPELPANVTQWNNWFECISKPQLGALLAYGDSATVSGPPGACAYNGAAADGAFWAIKWAEIGETYESINFARPGGADKFLLDETAVYCFDSQAGQVVTLTLPDDTSLAVAPFTTNDIVGGACVGGFFHIASVSGLTVTLGTQAFLVPSDWTTPSGDQGTAFGRLRFPTAPSILGRVTIRAVGDAAGNAAHAEGWTPTYEFATAQMNFAKAWANGGAANQEQVTIYDYRMQVLASNVTASRISDTKFYLTADYTGAYFLMVAGAPAYQYGDNFPKGDFVFLEWLYDWRTNAEIDRVKNLVDCGGHTPPSDSPTTGNQGYTSFTETADALPTRKCHPRVACFSPNGETWPNGKTYPFPSTFALDSLYGSKWQAQVHWSITDPLWQAPHTPCGLNSDDSDGGDGGDGTDTTTAWTMDPDGSCPDNVDGIVQYYPLAPMVEARATVPPGFPALPPGITIGFSAPGSSTNSTNPPGPAGYAVPNGTPASILTPWILAENLCTSIEGGCRFDYENWFIGCAHTS